MRLYGRRTQQLLLFLLLAANIECACRVLLVAQGYERKGQTANRSPLLGWRTSPTLINRKLWQQAPKGERINSDGLRGEEVPPLPGPDVTRVLCLGGSVTFGAGREEEFAYPRQLERVLNASGRRFQVINAGVIGFSSDQMINLLEELQPRYKPDVVTIMCGLNEKMASSYRALEPLKAAEMSQPYIDSTRNLLTHLAVYRYLVYRLLPSPTRPPADAVVVRGDETSTLPNQSLTLTNSVDNLTVLASFAQSRKFKLIFLEEAHRVDGVPDPTTGYYLSDESDHEVFRRDDYFAYVGRLRDAHRALAARLSIPFLDMMDVVRDSGRPEGELFIPISLIHLQENGSDLVARALGNLVLEVTKP